MELAEKIRRDWLDKIQAEGAKVITLGGEYDLRSGPPVSSVLSFTLPVRRYQALFARGGLGRIPKNTRRR